MKLDSPISRQYYSIFSLSLCFVQFSLPLVAQQAVKGYIVDVTTKQGVPDVYVMLFSKDGKQLLSYSFSDEGGNFVMDFPQGTEQMFNLQTSRMGYETYNATVSRSSKQIEIALKENSIPLREVKVDAKPIRQRGDAIDYYVSNFVRTQDKTLADVLARMPGIDVTSDGRIQYEGKPINRFYIENLNLLDQRYSLATNNLSPSDISTVQVYENHEPIKMLKDHSLSEQAALNIKLKEGARAKWLHTFDFGVGMSPFLFNINTALARFARTNQTLFVGKANNSGKDLFTELKMHTLKSGEVFRPSVAEGVPDQLLPLSIVSSMMTKERSRFNQTAIVSANQLWRIAQDIDVRANINYGYDKSDQWRKTTTLYHLEQAPSIVLADEMSQQTYWHKWENELALESNQTNYHLQQKLQANLHWKEAIGDIIIGDNRLSQTMQLPRTHLKNFTSWSKLYRGLSWQVSNQTDITYLPQSMQVEGGSPLHLFARTNAQQVVEFNDGMSHTFLSLNKSAHQHTVDVKLGAELVWQQIMSTLEPAPILKRYPDFRFVNSSSWSSQRFYLEPLYKWDIGMLDVSASAALNYLLTSYNQTVRDDYFYLNPKVRLQFEPSSSFKAFAGYQYNFRFGDLNDMQTGFVFKRYNSFEAGWDDLQRTASNTWSWGTTYRNVNAFFTLNYLGFFATYHNNLTPSTIIQDGYTFSWMKYNPYKSSFLMNKLTSSKLFSD